MNTSNTGCKRHGEGNHFGVSGGLRLLRTVHTVIAVMKTTMTVIPIPRPRPSFAPELSETGPEPAPAAVTPVEDGTATEVVVLVSVADDLELETEDALLVKVLVGVIGPKRDDARDVTEASAAAWTPSQNAEKEGLPPCEAWAHSATNAKKFAVSACWRAVSACRLAISPSDQDRIPKTPKMIAVTAPSTCKKYVRSVSGRLRSSGLAAMFCIARTLSSGR